MEDQESGKSRKIGKVPTRTKTTTKSRSGSSPVWSPPRLLKRCLTGCPNGVATLRVRKGSFDALNEGSGAGALGKVSKILVSVKFLSAILGPEVGASILWTPGKMRSFCRKTHVHKIPRFRGGGVFWVWGGWGGSADFVLMGARIFLTKWSKVFAPYDLPALDGFELRGWKSQSQIVAILCRKRLLRQPNLNEDFPPTLAFVFSLFFHLFCDFLCFLVRFWALLNQRVSKYLRGDRDHSTMSPWREVLTMYWQAIVAHNLIILQHCQGENVAFLWQYGCRSGRAERQCTGKQMRVLLLPPSLNVPEKGQEGQIGTDEPRSGEPPLWNHPV